MKKILAIIGARPQFIKHAPIELAMKDKAQLVTIHTGQHYDERMSQIFFDELKMTPPKYQLNVGSATHGVQTGKMMAEIDKILLDEKPDAVLVYGDTNSTLAGALCASKLHIPVIHIEAGLRSFNKKMPEELNRVLTDHVSNLLFAPTNHAVANLEDEGITENVYKSGDVMCDMALIAKERVKNQSSSPYILVTIHRPYNTDDKVRITEILTQLNALGTPVKFPMHPRTKNLLATFGISMEDFQNIEVLTPQSYFDTIELLANCSCLVTDSGGMQKEAYILEKQCVTIRSETEWVETLENGWNQLIFDDLSQLAPSIRKEPGQYTPNIYGDGTAAISIAQKIFTHF